MNGWSWIVGLILLLVGVALLAVCWRGSQGRLDRAGGVGIRTGATRSSDEAWLEAHRAAASPLGLGGGVAICASFGVLAAGLDLVGVVLVVIGVVGSLAAVVVAFVAGHRAARAVQERGRGSS